MAIYTKSGDGGFSRLPGPNGGPLRKDDVRFAALGAVDELTAAIGLCLCEAKRGTDQRLCEMLSPVQQELLGLGALLAATFGGGASPVEIDPAATTRMERHIDQICAQLPDLKQVILPGGCELAGRLHLARTIARRAERAVVAAVNPPPSGQAGSAVMYLNRLSDLLFVLARLANHNAGSADVPWAP